MASDVDHDEGDRHILVLAEGDQPRQRRIADPGVPVGLVHGDAERGVVEVGGIQGKPVEELAVVAIGRRGLHALRELGGVREMVAEVEEHIDVAVGPEPAPHDEADRPHEGDQARDGGPVRPRPERRA